MLFKIDDSFTPTDSTTTTKSMRENVICKFYKQARPDIVHMYFYVHTIRIFNRIEQNIICMIVKIKQADINYTPVRSKVMLNAKKSG